jgi:hypothetical protein
MTVGPSVGLLPPPHAAEMAVSGRSPSAACEQMLLAAQNYAYLACHGGRGLGLG